MGEYDCQENGRWLSLLNGTLASRCGLSVPAVCRHVLTCWKPSLEGHYFSFKPSVVFRLTQEEETWSLIAAASAHSGARRPAHPSAVPAWSLQRSRLAGALLFAENGCISFLVWNDVSPGIKSWVDSFLFPPSLFNLRFNFYYILE